MLVVELIWIDLLLGLSLLVEIKFFLVDELMLFDLYFWEVNCLGIYKWKFVDFLDVYLLFLLIL